MANNVFAALAGKTEGDHSAVKSMAEMFGLSENVRITVLPIAKLKEKSNHPFKVIEDERLAALAESIRTEGLIHPVIVRTANDGFYEILSGHRRTRACRMIGETEIKAIIVTADDELANRIMIDTNFQQRESHLPSEIAKSYGIRYNDIKKRQKRHAKNSIGPANPAHHFRRLFPREQTHPPFHPFAFYLPLMYFVFLWNYLFSPDVSTAFSALFLSWLLHPLPLTPDGSHLLLLFLSPDFFCHTHTDAVSAPNLPSRHK